MLTSILVLEGCVSMPPVPTASDQFSLKGKIAVSDGEEQFSANILWSQRGNSFEIDLWGPLGQGRVRLVKEGEQVVLRNGRGEILTEGDAETVMRRHLGWSLPIEVLPAWVQGEALAEVASQEPIYGEMGELTTFRQLGWRVRLDRYRMLEGVGGPRYLPGRINAEKDTARLRLVITEWQI